MYVISAADKPREISAFPQSSVGAPCPSLIADENTLRICYYLEVERLSPAWREAEVLPPAAGDSDDLCAVVTFGMPYVHMFGPPNDEAFSGHPLASRGLEPYGAFEVEHSSWIRDLERMNAVHPHHRPERFPRFKHFILSFHDTTFECIAETFNISLCRGSVQRVLVRSLHEV